MRQSFLILFFILTPLLTFCQELISSKKIELDQNSNALYEVIAIPNPQHQETVIFFIKESEIEFYRLNELMETQSNSSILRGRDIGYRPVGYAVDGYEYLLFFTNSNLKNYIIYSINSLDNSRERKSIEINDEFIIDYVSTNDHFYILTMNNYENEIKIHDFTEFDEQKTMSFQINNYGTKNNGNNIFKRLFITEEDIFSKKANTNVVIKNSPRPLENVANLNKIYTNNQNLILTMDDPNDGTLLVNFNLLETDLEIAFYPTFTSICDVSYPKTSNSFFNNNILYQVGYCNNSIHIQAYDLQTNTQLIEDYQLDINNLKIIDISGTSFFANDIVREVKKEKRLLKKIEDNISIISYDEEIIIGYNEKEDTGPGVWVTDNNSYIDINNEKRWLPSTNYYDGNAHYTAYPYGKSIFVKIDNTLNVNKTKTANSFLENILSFSKEEKASAKTFQALFDFNGSVYWSYYDNSNETYNVVKF